MIRNTTIFTSLIAAAGIIVLWVWSFTGEYEILGCFPSLEIGWEVDIHESIWIGGSEGVFALGVSPSFLGEQSTALAGFLFEFEIKRFQVSVYGFEAYAASPFWPLLIISLLYPSCVLICGPVRRWRRRRCGLCIGCGYDLRGNVSGVCPECGSQSELCL